MAARYKRKAPDPAITPATSRLFLAFEYLAMVQARGAFLDITVLISASISPRHGHAGALTLLSVSEANAILGYKCCRN